MLKKNPEENQCISKMFPSVLYSFKQHEGKCQNIHIFDNYSLKYYNNSNS